MSLSLVLGYLCCAAGALLGAGSLLWLGWDWDLALLAAGMVLLGLRLLDPGEDEGALADLIDSTVNKLRD